MTTEDLINFIQVQIRKNVSRPLITSRLEKAGWHSDDIAEAFRKITPPPKHINPEVVPVVKPQILSQSLPSLSSLELVSVPPEKIIANIPIIPIVMIPTVSPLEIIIPIAQTNDIISNFIEEEPISYQIPESIEIEPEPTKIELKSPTIYNPTPLGHFSAQSSEVVKPVFSTNEELIPKLIPKPKPPLSFHPTDSVVKNLPEAAIITTFPRDVIASQNVIQELPYKKSKKTTIIIFIIIVVLSFIIGAVFAMGWGSNLLSSFSFVKKDPKVLLINTYSGLKNLQSYKSQTLVTVSSASFANITNGLISGDRVTSNNKDSISININSVINNDNNGSLSNFKDYIINIKSSLLKNDINSDLKYDGNQSYLFIPNFHLLLPENSPPSGLISIKNNQFDSLLYLIPDTIADKIRNIDIYHILSEGFPKSITNSTQILLKEFIDKASVTEKDSEDIRGVATYHYQMVIDQQAVKKFLSSLFDTFTMPLSDDDKKNIDEAFGSTTLDTLEIWIGKSDSMVHQFKFSLSTPLSKVINLEDKGIAGNKVTFDWQTTYYDFNVSNTIVIPTDAIPVTDFLKSALDLKIENTLSLLKPATSLLHNALGSYGNRSNPTGSCTNPNPGSLFSPVGHTKGANNAVGTIANIMNNILNTTNGSGSCFSTSNAWAASFPLASDPLSAYCVDSNGLSVKLTTPLMGTVCK